VSTPWWRASTASSARREYKVLLPDPLSESNPLINYSLNVSTKAFHLQEFDKGNSWNTVAYVQALQALYPGKKLWLLWENASYHRCAEMSAFLATVNNGLSEEEWNMTCIPFATDAPEQNPVEDIWFAGKNFTRNKTFVHVKKCFVQFLSSLAFDSRKLDWYYPQII
jgi:hypothetical protein